jgi:hypothetical protein
MGEFSVFHWLVVFALLANTVPVGMVLKRTGHSPGWCVLIFVPLVNLIMLWVFAFKRWPIDVKPPSTTSQRFE